MVCWWGMIEKWLANVQSHTRKYYIFPSCGVFIEGLDAKEYALNKETLNKINFELGKTLRRSDSDLDYLPTQYISDFIKSIKHNNVNEYSGIEYNSVMYEKGYNLAIFDPELFECINTEVYRIENVTYHIHQIR